MNIEINSGDIFEVIITEMQVATESSYTYYGFIIDSNNKNVYHSDVIYHTAHEAETEGWHRIYREIRKRRFSATQFVMYSKKGIV